MVGCEVAMVGCEVAMAGCEVAMTVGCEVAMVGCEVAMVGCEVAMAGCEEAMTVGCEEAMVGCEEALVGCEVAMMVGCEEAMVGCEEAMVGCEEAMLGCEEAMVGCEEAMVGCAVAMVGCEEAMVGCEEAMTVGCEEAMLLRILPLPLRFRHPIAVSLPSRPTRPRPLQWVSPGVQLPATPFHLLPTQARNHLSPVVLHLITRFASCRSAVVHLASGGVAQPITANRRTAETYTDIAARTALGGFLFCFRSIQYRHLMASIDFTSYYFAFSFKYLSAMLDFSTRIDSNHI